MPRPYTQLYLHLVWSTWDRLPMIVPEVEGALHQAIRAEFARMGCIPLATGGTEDHIHCLVSFPVTETIAGMVKQVKGSSSHLMTHRLAGPDRFKWQGSYSAFTVTKGAVDRVRDYVLSQKRHHISRTVWPEWERTVADDDVSPANELAGYARRSRPAPTPNPRRRVSSIVARQFIGRGTYT